MFNAFLVQTEDENVLASMEEELNLWERRTGMGPEEQMSLPLPPHTRNGQRLQIDKFNVARHPLLREVHRAFFLESKAKFDQLRCDCDESKDGWKQQLVQTANRQVRNFEAKLVPGGDNVWIGIPWLTGSDMRRRPFVVLENGGFGYDVDGILLEPAFTRVEHSVEPPPPAEQAFPDSQ